MSIAWKLRIVLAIIALLMGFFVGVIGLGVYRSSHEIQMARQVVEHLTGSARVRTAVNRQVKEVMAFLVSGKQANLSRVREYSRQTKESLALLGQAEQNVKAFERSRAGKDTDSAAHIAIIEEQYQRALVLLNTAMELATQGRQQEAFAFMENNVEPWIDDVLLRSIDETINKEIDEVSEAYDRILLAMGANPWFSRMVITELEKARRQVRLFLIVDHAQTATNRFNKEIYDYVISGDEVDRQEYRYYAVTVVEALNEWALLVGLPGNDGEGTPHDNLSSLRWAEQMHRRIVSRLDQVVYDLGQGRRQLATDALLVEVAPLVDEQFLPRLSTVHDQTLRSIDTVHKRLLQMGYASGVKGVAITLVVAGVVLIIFLRLIRGTIMSLERLGVGVQKIGAGQLEHIIDIQSADEFGKMASLLNGMASEVGRSRNDLVVAKEAAEDAARQLQQSNEELRAYTFIASHDLRTPLVTIQGFSGELRHHLQVVQGAVVRSAPQLPEKQREALVKSIEQEIPEALGFIEMSVKKMEGIISSIGKLSQIGERTLKMERIDLQGLIARILDGESDRIEAQDVVVSVEALPEVVSDRIALEQILNHLLDNALKYLVPGRRGEIAIRAERGDRATTVYVSDNGRGIPREDLQKVFELFRRSGRHAEEGEGMGLAYVKTMLRRLGGEVWCKSEVGIGTIVIFTIPLHGESDSDR